MGLNLNLALGLSASIKGVGFVVTLTVLRQARIMRDNLRMTDNG